VDELAIQNICNYFIKSKVSFVVVQGTTGESSTLSENEKEFVNDSFIKNLYSKIPLVLGIGSNNTNEIISKLKSFDLSHFDAIMSVCPYYSKPSQSGIIKHFEKVSEHSSKPIILYNVPSRTGIDMTDETIIHLSKSCQNIIGVKEASGIPSRINHLRTNTHSDFVILSGDDFTMIDAFKNGADGIISVAANAYPTEFNDIIKEINSNNFNVDDSNFFLKEFIKLIFDECNPSGIKYALNSLSLCPETVRLPLDFISDSLKERIDNFISNRAPQNI
jgi:4-hydroxy-tetrahydrodipicolinate synthase